MLALVAVVGVASTAHARQTPAVAVGQIESIGIGNMYRPGDWVPMVVRVDSATLEPGTYTVRIEQRDLDGQKVFWSRSVPVTGSGGERFEVYFKPDPLDGGLVDPADPLHFLRRMRVLLLDDGGSEVGLFQAQGQPNSSDDQFNTPRDIRLVVAVTPTPVPAGDYGDRSLRGIAEDVAFLEVRPEDLPRSVLGYDMADAILWGDYPPGDLTPEQRRAIEEFVLRGGHLVVMQRPDEWQTMLEWGGLLPVDLTGTTDVSLPGLFEQWAVEPVVRDRDTNEPVPAMWPNVRGSATLGTATPRLGALLETRWSGGEPLIVRDVHGSGAVTWMGIDPVADPELSRPSRGWAGIWKEVFGWPDDPAFIDMGDSNDRTSQRYQSAGAREFGFALLDGMRQSGKSATLVGIAIFFFVGYWLVAGPGVYLYLAARKRTTLSWFVFGAAAVVATAFTLGIVNLVLRGSPDLAHITLLRGSFDDDNPGLAVAYSNVGLYIPSDGAQELTLGGFDETNVST
ncbi:MAG: hypothetical protein AAF656_01145, partial [Planctomycetota bacterium]